MKHGRIAVMCFVLFAVVLTLGGSAFAQSKMTTRLQHWTSDSSGWRQLANKDVTPMFWPGGTFGSDSGGVRETTGMDSATWNFGYGAYGYALLWWMSPFAQKWYVEAYIENVVGNHTLVGMSYIENYYHHINVKLPSGVNASSSQHNKRFGKSGYGTGSATNATFKANTVDITDYFYFPYIFNGTQGAYSLYIIDTRGSTPQIALEIPMSGDFYSADGILDLVVTLSANSTTRAMSAEGDTANVAAAKLSTKRLENTVERITEFKKRIAAKKAEMLTAPKGQDASKAVKESSSTDERKVGEKREPKKENRRNATQSKGVERKARNRRR